MKTTVPFELKHFADRLIPVFSLIPEEGDFYLSVPQGVYNGGEEAIVLDFGILSFKISYSEKSGRFYLGHISSLKEGGTDYFINLFPSFDEAISEVKNRIKKESQELTCFLAYLERLVK